MTTFIRKYPATSLFLLAFLLGPALVAPTWLGILPRGFVQLGALSASAAGVILAAIEGGRPAVRELLGRALVWRVGWRWWAVALVLPAVPAIVARYLTIALGDGTVTEPKWTLLVPTLLFQIVFAGVGEEFGWRGFALPRIQRNHRALTATLIVGGYHSVWHLPLFLLPGDTYAGFAAEIGLLPAFLGYSVLVISLSVLFGWVFNSTGGSVLLAATFHGTVNGWNNHFDLAAGGMTSLFRYVGLLVVLAVAVVVIFGATNLARHPRIVLPVAANDAT